jgi:hypothetical protein
MKLLSFLFTLPLLLAVALNAGAADKPAGATKLVHMVSFKFKTSATPDQIAKVEEAFRALKKSIPQIKSYEWGTNVSPEKHDKGFTHGFILSFASDKDRDAYLVHPEHKAFGAMLGPILEDVFVIDFWAQK